MIGTAQIIRGNALDLPLADESVDLIVTSPPYFGLRSYQDGGEHYGGQIGDEATPAEFVEALVAATAEMVRVLKSSGSIWVNLGDAYFSGRGAPGRTTVDAKNAGRTARRAGGNALDGPPFGIGRKSLCGVPWRYALRCIDDLGLILRAEVIWSKPNGLPESVTDRVRRSHETWFHFTLEPRYFSAVDEIREEHARIDAPRPLGTRNATQRHLDATDNTGWKDHAVSSNPLGKLPGSVWTIPTQPLRVPESLGIDHFAAFPMEWPRRIIRGWSPAGVCDECGEGRRPVTSKTPEWEAFRSAHNMGDWNDADGYAAKTNRSVRTSVSNGAVAAFGPKHQIAGYVCACPEPTAPTTAAVVLDPFGGTGTTALVAKALGRHGISNDMSADYCRLAQWRTNDEGELARAMQVDKPAEQVKGQESLLDLIEEGAA